MCCLCRDGEEHQQQEGADMFTMGLHTVWDIGKFNVSPALIQIAQFQVSDFKLSMQLQNLT
jgi:hypothetical protein